MMMNDVRVSPRKQSKGSFGADHVDRLPKAVEDQHGLIESGLHLGLWS